MYSLLKLQRQKNVKKKKKFSKIEPLISLFLPPFLDLSCRPTWQESRDLKPLKQSLPTCKSIYNFKIRWTFYDRILFYFLNQTEISVFRSFEQAVKWNHIKIKNYRESIIIINNKSDHRLIHDLGGKNCARDVEIKTTLRQLHNSYVSRASLEIYLQLFQNTI